MDFKVRCVKNNSNFTEDKEYAISNGKITDDTGVVYGEACKIKSVSDLNERLCSQFEPVEDKPSFKVRCVETRDSRFKVNKIYEVNSKGKILDECGLLSTADSPVDTFEKWFEDGGWTDYKFELVTEPKPFTKTDLRTGMRVELRNGNKYVYIDGGNLKGFVNGGQSLFLDWYNNDLFYDNINSGMINKGIYDIVKVFEPADFLIKIFNPNYETKLIYHRHEPRKLTIPEATKLLKEHLEEEIEIVKE